MAVLYMNILQLFPLISLYGFLIFSGDLERKQQQGKADMKKILEGLNLIYFF